MFSHPVTRRSPFVLVPLVSRLLASAAAVFGFAALAEPADSADPVSPAERPNVVFILVDDLGYMDIGAYNPDTFYETPNVDRLAAMSLRFTDGYAANPVCSPTRYSVMTGRYPTRVDATNFFSGTRSGRFNPAPLNDKMPLDEVTLADAFGDAGYRTFFAGKWHLGPTPEYWPENRGFDVNRGGHSRGAPNPKGRYFPPYGNPRLDDGPEGEHLTQRLADETCQFIRDAGDEPYLAYLSFYTVHTPLMAPEDRVEKYRRKIREMNLEDVREFAPEEQVWPDANQQRQVRIVQKHPVYAAMVESMDLAVGQVLDTLEQKGDLDNTVICFMSDNGGLSTSEGSPTSNLPLRGGKGWLYEGGIREPFMIRAPGVTSPGSVCREPVTSTDFYPTLLSLIGADPRPEQHLDGRDLTPLLRGANSLDRDALYWHYPHYSNQGGFPGAAIRMGDWKLIERFEEGETHLYHLTEDIGERNDVSEQHPERAAAMREKLHAWYATVDAKFLQPKENGPTPWRP